MLKLTVAAAAAALVSLNPAAEARPDTRDHGSRPSRRAPAASRTTISYSAPAAWRGRPDLRPIVLTGEDVQQSLRRRGAVVPDIASIPTYPTYFEATRFPGRTYFAASYAPPSVRPPLGVVGGAPIGVATSGNVGVVRTTYAPVSWGQAVPIVEVRPVPAAPVPAYCLPTNGSAAAVAAPVVEVEGEEVYEK